MFGRYFLLGVPKDDVPQSLIDLVVKASASAEAIAGLLRQLRDEGRLPALLSRLGAYTAVLDLELAENFITALFDVGEELSDRGENMFDLGGPAMSANRVVYHWLKREPDPKVRSAILLNAIRRSKGLHLPLDRVSLEVQRHAKDKLEESHFTAADLDEAKHIVLERVEAAAKDGQLLGTRLLRYLWRWRNLAGADAPKTFVAAQITTARGALMLLQGMMEEVNVASLSSGVQRQKRGLHIRTLQEFLDVDKLTEILSPLLGSEVAPEHRELVNSFAEELRAFKRALHRKAKGMPDDDSFDDD
jgi:hypothetical protein